MLLADYHTHTVYSHGKGTVEDNVRAALALGIKTICITDHGGGHLFYGVRGEALLRQRREIDALNRKYAGQIEIHMGIEANLVGFGKTDLPKKNRDLFECVILGYHKGVFPRDALAFRWLWRQMFGHKPEQGWRNAEALAAAAEDLQCVFAFSHPGTHIPVDVKYLSQAAAQLGVMMELNEHHEPMAVADIRTAAACGAHFILSSDAHRPQDVGKVPHALAAAREAGVIPLVKNWQE